MATGIRSFRVLTVTKSIERTRSLLAVSTAAARLASRLAPYWFARLPKAPAAAMEIFEPIWQSAADLTQTHSLLPTLV